jgi:hypothetical protein
VQTQKEGGVKHQFVLESEILAFERETSVPVATCEGATLTQVERDALAVRIAQVILERKRTAAERRRQVRLRQLQSVERSRDGSQLLPQA